MQRAVTLVFQGIRIVVAQFAQFLRSEVLFLGRMEVFFHLADDMLRFMVVFDIEIHRRPGHFIGVPAVGTEFPALEIVHVRKCPASRAPDDRVHDHEVIHAITIKIYRRLNGREIFTR